MIDGERYDVEVTNDEAIMLSCLDHGELEYDETTYRLTLGQIRGIIARHEEAYYHFISRAQVEAAATAASEATATPDTVYDDEGKAMP